MSPGGSTMASYEDINSFLARNTPLDHLIRTYFEQIGVVPKVVFNILEKLVLLLGRRPFNNEIPVVGNLQNRQTTGDILIGESMIGVRDFSALLGQYLEFELLKEGIPRSNHRLGIFFSKRDT
ncbi:hypothetical protein Tco_0246686 [Tanacetum coccineum]